MATRIVVKTNVVRSGHPDSAGDFSVPAGHYVTLKDGEVKAAEALEFGDELPEPLGARSVVKVESYDSATQEYTTLSEAPA